MIHDNECCSWDEDGNPEVCSGPAKEEPDCPPCGDTGHRYVDVNGDPADWWERRVAAGEIEFEESPF